MCSHYNIVLSPKTYNRHPIASWWEQAIGCCLHVSSTSGPRLNIKAVFPDIGIPIIKIRWSSDRLILIMGITFLVRQHLCIETTPWSRFYIHHCWAIGNIVILDHVEIRPDCIYTKNNGLQDISFNETPCVLKDSVWNITRLGLINLTNKSFQWGSNIRLGPSCFELDQYGDGCISIVRDSSCTTKQ